VSRLASSVALGAIALTLVLGSRLATAEPVRVGAGPALDLRLPPELLLTTPDSCAEVGLRLPGRGALPSAAPMAGPLGRSLVSAGDFCASVIDRATLGAAPPRARLAGLLGPRLHRVDESLHRRAVEPPTGGPKTMAERDRAYITSAGQRVGFRHAVARHVDLGWSLWTDLDQSATLAAGNSSSLGIGTTARGLLDELKAAAEREANPSGATMPALPFALALRLNLRFPPPGGPPPGR
jgi:hypothetical protein